MIVQHNYTPFVVLACVILIAAIGLGFLLSEKKPLESTDALYTAYANATRSALHARGQQALLEATETPRAQRSQLQQTQTALVAHATQTQQRAFFSSAQTKQAEEARVTQTAQVDALHAQQTRDLASFQATQTLNAAVVKAKAAQAQQTVIASDAQDKLALAQRIATETALGVEAQNRVLHAEETRTASTIDRSLTRQAAQATAEMIAQTPVREAEAERQRAAREWIMIFTIALSVTALAIGLCAFIVLHGRAAANLARAKMFAEQRRMIQVDASVRAYFVPSTPPKIIPFAERSQDLATDPDQEKAA